jgi:hypothetical protein
MDRATVPIPRSILPPDAAVILLAEGCQSKTEGSAGLLSRDKDDEDYNEEEDERPTER